MPVRFPLPALLTAVLLSAPAGAQTPPAAAAPKVTVAAARIEQITGDTTFIGRVEAVDSVELVARVSGYLRAVEVANGAQVTTGQALFVIEPENYEATVQSSRAQLERAEAAQTLARIELDRKAQLVRKGAVPQSELDIATANEKAAQADIAAAAAALQQAQLNLSYTRMTAPFDGQIGKIAKSIGDLVGPETGALATLVRTTPIYVVFSVSERQIANLMEARVADGENPSATPMQLPIHVDLPNGRRLDEVGVLAFSDNRIDTATGTLAVRAEFPNADRLLIPGAFVTLHVQTAEPRPELLIPQAAVQRDQRGPFVLVIGAQQTVEQRYITTGGTEGTEVIVQSGLAPGESVIVEGLQRVKPGVPVQPVPAAAKE